MAAQTRSKDQIEAEIGAARERLAASIAGVVSQVQPNAIVQRGIDDARAFASAEFAHAKSQVIDDDGRWRQDRLLLIGGAVVGVITFVVLIGAIAGRASR